MNFPFVNAEFISCPAPAIGPGTISRNRTPPRIKKPRTRAHRTRQQTKEPNL